MLRHASTCARHTPACVALGRQRGRTHSVLRRAHAERSGHRDEPILAARARVAVNQRAAALMLAKAAARLIGPSTLLLLVRLFSAAAERRRLPYAYPQAAGATDARVLDEELVPCDRPCAHDAPRKAVRGSAVVEISAQRTASGVACSHL